VKHRKAIQPFPAENTSPGEGEKADSQPTGEAAAVEIDIVSDVIRRVRELIPGLTGSVAQRVEADVRRDWGGDSAYIAKTGESLAQRQARCAARDEAIRRDHHRGDHEDLLIRRYSISQKRLRQILAGKRSP
jgi:Mor family transcriptional regulator